MTKKLIREYVEADVWLPLYAAIFSHGSVGVRDAAKLADIALAEYEQRYVATHTFRDGHKRWIVQGRATP